MGNSSHPNHTVLARKLQDYLAWRNANARHPDVLAASAANAPASAPNASNAGDDPKPKPPDPTGERSWSAHQPCPEREQDRRDDEVLLMDFGDRAAGFWFLVRELRRAIRRASFDAVPAAGIEAVEIRPEVLAAIPDERRATTVADVKAHIVLSRRDSWPQAQYGITGQDPAAKRKTHMNTDRDPRNGQVPLPGFAESAAAGGQGPPGPNTWLPPARAARTRTEGIRQRPADVELDGRRA